MGLDDYNIESKIILSRFYNRVKKKARGSRCLLCGKKTDGFCKSHSVPQFSLKYIAESGMVFHPSIFMDIESLDVEKGVMNSGIFQRICRECDGRFFQDYENERNLQKHLTDKILAEICIKNVLYTLDEKIEEILTSDKAEGLRTSIMNFIVGLRPIMVILKKVSTMQ